MYIGNFGRHCDTYTPVVLYRITTVVVVVDVVGGHNNTPHHIYPFAHLPDWQDVRTYDDDDGLLTFLDDPYFFPTTQRSYNNCKSV